MEQLMEYLINQLEQIRNSNLEDENEIQRIDEYISKLNAIKSNPTLIDDSLFHEILTNEQLSSKEYGNMIYYKGAFAVEAYRNQSQIKKSLEYLDSLLDAKLAEFGNTKTELLENINSRNEGITKISNVKDILDGYDDTRYITADEIKSIHEVVETITPTENLVEFYIKIAKANVSIEKQKEEELQQRLQLQIQQAQQISQPEPVEEVIEEPILEIEESIENDDQRYNAAYFLEKRKEYLRKYLAFKNNSEYRELDEELYDEVYRFIDDFDIALNECDDATFEYCILAEDDTNILKDLKNKNVFLIGTTIAALKAFESGDVEQIRKIFNARLKNKYMYSTEEYLKLSDYAHYLEKMNNVDNYVHIDEFKKSEKYKIISSFEGLSDEERIKNMNITGITDDDYYTYLIVLKFDEIKKELSERNIDEGIEEIIDDEFEDLMSRYERLKKIREKTSDEEKTVEKVEVIDETESQEEKDRILEKFEKEGFYPEGFNNYILFFDEHKFIESYNDTLNYRGEVKVQPVDYLQKFDTIINKKLVDLHKEKVSHNIHIRPKKKNPWDVREVEHGPIRVGYKVLKNANVEGHNVVVVFLSCYGLDDNIKDTELKKNLKMYKDREDEFKKLSEIFAKEKNKEKATDEVRKMLDSSEAICKSILEQAIIEENENKKNRGVD